MTVKGEGFLTILQVQKEYKPPTISLDGISNSDNIIESERNSSNIVYYLKASTDKEYTIIISWNILLKDAFEMFSSCHEIVFLDLSHFDASLISRMDGMFQYCISLESINFGNFNTKSVIHGRNIYVLQIFKNIRFK